MEYKGYDVNNNGIIIQPGKFEGEIFFVLDLYEMAMNGMLDVEYDAYDDSEDIHEDMDNQAEYYTCTVDQDLIDELSTDLSPELQVILKKTLENVDVIEMFENDCGFVSLSLKQGVKLQLSTPMSIFGTN